jgi:hypothetical protein
VTEDHQLAKAAQAQRRLEQREREQLWVRLRWAQQRIVMRSTVDAVSFDTKTASRHPESQAPPGAFSKDSMVETGFATVDRLLKPIMNAIIDLEAALDFDQGLSTGRETTTMIGAEKDWELLNRWSGVHSEVVARQAPHLGSKATIERARRRLGVRPTLGLEKDWTAAA